MGSSSEYELTANSDDRAIIDLVIEKAKETEEYFGYAMSFSPRKNEVTGHWFLPTAGGVKWYDVEDDLKALSSKIPNIHLTMFVLYSEGLRWQFHALNGKTQRCYGYVVYEPFDPNKLV